MAVKSDTVMMPGGPVSRAYYEERQRRLAAGVCVATRGGRLCCARAVSAEIRAIGCGICAACTEDEDEREGEMDGLAASRTTDYGWRDE
jgi:hypothetical protein